MSKATFKADSRADPALHPIPQALEETSEAGASPSTVIPIEQDGTTAATLALGDRVEATVSVHTRPAEEHISVNSAVSPSTSDAHCNDRGDDTAPLVDKKSTKHTGGLNDQLTGCLYCTWKERLGTFAQLQVGSHVTFGGLNSLRNYRGRQYYMYTHHAIVEKVDVLGPFTALLTMIHYISSSDSELRLQRTTELKNLRYDEIHVVHYRHHVYEPEQIIERADAELRRDKKEKPYSLATNNCEHFCHWCCIGINNSVQVDEAKHKCCIWCRYCVVGCATIVKLPLRVMFSVMSFSDEVTTLTYAVHTRVALALFALVFVFALAYSIYKSKLCCNCFTCNQFKDSLTVCQTCLKWLRIETWLQFLLFLVFQGIGLYVVLYATLSKELAFGIGCACNLISICSLLCDATIIRKGVISPFEGKTSKISSSHGEVKPGDVIKLKRTCGSITGIVSDSWDSYVSLIYYKGGIVVEEEHGFKSIEKLDYALYKCSDAQKVIKRARQRKGERKYSCFLNRSSHFCHSNKVDEDNTYENPTSANTRHAEIIYSNPVAYPEDGDFIYVDHRVSRKYATKRIGVRKVLLTDDVKIGQVISIGRSHKRAICIEKENIENEASQLKLTVVGYGKDGKMCKEAKTFDLNTTDIWIYIRHPVFCFSQEDLLKRAKNSIGQTYSRCDKRITEIVESDIYEKLDDFARLKPGDVIKFTYKCKGHHAVVSEVKENQIDGIHYATDCLRHIIKEENLTMYLKARHFYLKKYDGFVTYSPEDVVKRAKARMNEKRFSHCRNTSSEFVHWAKVVQTPSLVEVRLHTADDENLTENKRAIILPKLVDTFTQEYFQEVPVYVWSELEKGNIVAYKSCLTWHQGILTEKNEAAEQIDVIRYKTTCSASMLVKEKVAVDLHKKDILVYRCDPTHCKEGDVIVREAEDSKKDSGSKYSDSWDFCKKLTIKPDKCIEPNKEIGTLEIVECI